MKYQEIVLENFEITAPQGAIASGQKGTWIADMQTALIALNYSVGNTGPKKDGVDGIIGPLTISALRKFAVDQELGDESQASLNEIVLVLDDVIREKGLNKQLTKNTEADIKTSGPERQTALSQDSVTQGKVGDVLDFIARYESGGNYNVISGGQTVSKLTDMTLAELVNFQNQLIRSKKTPSSAAGRYQYIRDSLVMVANQMKLDLNTAKFDAATQDAIATFDLRRRAQMDQWLSGQLSDADFLNKVAKIWAGIPTTSGISAYQGVGNNKAGTTSQSALATLQSIKTPPSTA